MIVHDPLLQTRMNTCSNNTCLKKKEFFKVQKIAREEKTVTAGQLTLPVHGLSTNLSTGNVDNKKLHIA